LGERIKVRGTPPSISSPLGGEDKGEGERVKGEGLL